MRHAGALAVLALLPFAAASAAGGPVSADSFYAMKTTTLAGQPADLAQYNGKVALVVNVASQCGLTPQYAGLQKLYDELKDKGFVILGFPTPLGVLRAVDAPLYEKQIADQLSAVAAKKGKGDLGKLLRAGDTWEVR